ncbi:IS66 family insertion sequence element accessory protein TnpB [Mediterranea massiliensis]|uniref:IS66 family insertion sequence element accessory protein TnpB n=1 Tax=Mediterranea massiliensis TaxID=1841865 RepID=UPI003B8A79AC
MLSVTGLNHFYYVRDFTDMHCKHSRVLSVIRERLHREPCDGDVFIVMSRNRRIVRMFSFDICFFTCIFSIVLVSLCM